MLHQLFFAGISEDLSDLQNKANYFKNRFLVIVICASIFFILQTWNNKTVEPFIKYRAYIFNGVPLVLYIVAIYLSFKNNHFVSKIIMLIAVNGQSVAASLAVGRYTGFNLYMFIIAVIPFMVFIIERKVKFFFTALTTILLISIEVYYNFWDIQPIMPKNQVTIGYLTSIILIPIILIVLVNDMQKTNIRIEQSLAKERKKSDDLLRNILPEKITAEIKSGRYIIADSYNDVSILFIDIVGFTKLSMNKSAGNVVNELNDIFCFIDGLIDTYGLEKIKTIGDAYMVASGLPEANDTHLEKLLDFAISLMQKRAELTFMGEELRIRIGIHAGPVVAGVIGKKKFIYDVWGETVNIASRMESSGVENKIQISESVYQRSRGKYLCEKRGIINIQGIGMMETYFLLKKID